MNLKEVVRIMKKNLLIIAPFVIVIALVALAFFMRNEKANQQSWAYDYDLDQEILNLGAHGKAIYHGETYNYEKDDQYFTFSQSGKESFKIRYEMTEGAAGQEAMYLYEPKTYDFAGEGTPNGLYGLWKAEDGASFEFTEQGTFMEDGYFYGACSVDENLGKIKLIYDSNFRFNDSYIYYQLEDGKIRVEYPWRLYKRVEE